MSSDKLIQAASLAKTSLSGHHEHEHEAPSITLHNETNNITNIVVAAAVAVQRQCSGSGGTLPTMTSSTATRAASIASWCAVFPCLACLTKTSPAQASAAQELQERSGPQMFVVVVFSLRCE